MKKKLFFVLVGFMATLLVFATLSCSKDCTKTSTELSCSQHCGNTGNDVYVYNRITNE